MEVRGLPMPSACLRPRGLPAAASPPPPGPAAPDVDNTVPERRLLRDPRAAALGACLGAAAGAGAAVALGLAGPLVGGAVGLALGAWLGDRHEPLLYDLRGIGRQVANRFAADRGSLLDTWDRAARALRGQSSPPPLTDRDRRASAPSRDGRRLYDGHDASRDLTGLASREGAPADPFRFQVEVAHLRQGAAHSHLDTVLLLDWDGPGDTQAVPGGQSPPTAARLRRAPALPFGLSGAGSPWKAAVRVRDDRHSEVVGPAGEALGPARDVEHSTRYSHVAFGVDKEALRSLGWRDGQPLRLRALTLKDGDPVPIDDLSDARGPGRVFRWEGRTVYYAVTDRFSNGDRSNDAGTDPADPQRFHGGDWQGLIDRLDYLQGLGVDCLWLSCPYEQDRGFLGMDGYHGYWPHEFRRPEPSFGDLPKLQELTRKAHERGMKVMLDVVVNHTGYEHPWRRDPQKREWFHREGRMTGPGQDNMEKGALAGLPDLAQENPEVRDYLLDVHSEWLRQSGVDAFRVDAVRHVPEPFLRGLNDRMHREREGFLTLGEVFWRDANFVAGYQNRTQDAMFDFPLAYALREVFASDPERGLFDRWRLSREMAPHNPDEANRLLWSNGGGSMHYLSRALANDRLYDHPGLLSTFLDNHDMTRFMGDCGGDDRKVKIAAAFLMGCRGMPSIYYGTEVGMTGMGADNRKDMEWGRNPALTAEFRRLIRARASSEALRTGTQQELHVARDTYALARVRPGEEVVCAYNNSEEEQTFRIPLKDTQAAEGDRLKDLLGSGDVTVHDGALEVTLPAKGYAYYRWA